MMLKVAVLSALVLAVSAQREIDVTPCDNPGNGKLIKFVVTPCTTDPCELKKGDVTNFGFTYLSDQDSKAVTIKGTVTGPFGIKLPIPGLDSDFCKVVQCPVEKDKTYVGSMNLKIARVPISKTTVEMTVSGDAGLSACFKFPVKLV